MTRPPSMNWQPLRGTGSSVWPYRLISPALTALASMEIIKKPSPVRRIPPPRLEPSQLTSTTPSTPSTPPSHLRASIRSVLKTQQAMSMDMNAFSPWMIAPLTLCVFATPM